MDWLEKLKKARELNNYDIDETLRRIQEERKNAEPGTDEFARLQEAYEKELKNKKLVQEMKYLGFPPDKIILTIGMLIIAGFGFALDLDSPKALRIAQFVLGLVKKV